MLLASIEPMEWWQRILWGLAALVFLPLCTVLFVAFASAVTSAIWVRLPRLQRRPWLGLVSAVMVAWLLFGAWVGVADVDMEMDRAMPGPTIWHAITEYGVTAWLTIEERNTDVLLEAPPITSTISLSATGIVFQIAVTIAVLYSGFRSWRWNVNRFSLRDPNRCPECGYDLQGALEKGCSECGWAREERTAWLGTVKKTGD
jgi:hypothetical protein